MLAVQEMFESCVTNIPPPQPVALLSMKTVSPSHEMSHDAVANTAPPSEAKLFEKVLFAVQEAVEPSNTFTAPPE